MFFWKNIAQLGVNWWFGDFCDGDLGEVCFSTSCSPFKQQDHNHFDVPTCLTSVPDHHGCEWRCPWPDFSDGAFVMRSPSGYWA